MYTFVDKHTMEYNEFIHPLYDNALMYEYVLLYSKQIR